MTDTHADTSSDTTIADEVKPPASNQMSDIEKIKAAHAARRAARRRPPRAPASSSAATPPSSSSPDNANGSSRDTSKGDNDNDTKEATATTSATSTAGDSGEAAEDAAEITQLREELKRLNLEMKSLHRNHINNIKEISAQRDMFAEQLAREQQRSGNPSGKHGSKNQSSRGGSGSNTALSVADVEAQLRAARIRNSDLESENTMLRDEVKQLNFRVQASKTLDAASNGYQQVVDDLVVVKLKCAQLSEEKEDLLRINKELTTTSNALSDSNGDLEKSRAQWVMQCAEVEKKRTELEKLLKQKSLELEQIRSGRDEARSDLQELKL